MLTRVNSQFCEIEKKKDLEISHMCECTVFLQARGAIQLIKIVCSHAHRGTMVTLSIEICTCRFLYLDVIFVRSGDEPQAPDRLQEMNSGV